ncbi:MAG: DEAD/DEAH box helicase [Candidatus Liptonbacteria bacterium]|nr:DEAD/DEAH box helicase [Candidatus Liptonbacteria bacterium]
MSPNEQSFYGLGIAPGILEVLDRLKFVTPTPIQAQSIPVAIEGKDLMGIAQTGTGKTLAFGIPLIQKLLQQEGNGLIIVPTRELALQVAESLSKIVTPLGVKVATLIGGELIGRQIRSLARQPRIVVGTPGRLIDHLEQKTISFRNVRVLVLDEADRMLDMGFAPQLKRIVSVVPEERQTMFFAATMPEEIVSMAKHYLKLPVRVEIARPGTTAKNVTQEVFFVSQDAKMRLLEKILGEYRGSVIVFAQMKWSVKRMTAHLRSLGQAVAEIHSNRSLAQRREALEGFRTGRYRILMATDVAARGIDVQNIELVVNYDLPKNVEDYVHRIGRTGRAGGSGHAISFARPNERRDVQNIERLIRSTLPVSKLPELPQAPSTPRPAFVEAHSRFERPRRFPSRGRRPFRSGPPNRRERGFPRRRTRDY